MTRTKPPTWTEILLLLAGGVFSIWGGLLHTGLYYIFYPPNPAYGLCLYILGAIFTGLFCWLVDENSENPDERPPDDSTD